MIVSVRFELNEEGQLIIQMVSPFEYSIDKGDEITLRLTAEETDKVRECLNPST